MYDKFVVEGKITHEDDTYFYTAVPGGSRSWNKKWYRRVREDS